MACRICGKSRHYAAGGGGSLIHIVGGAGQGISRIALGNRDVRRSLGEGHRVLLGLDGFDFYEDVETALGLGRDGRNLVARAGFRAAVPHDVVIASFAPKEADMVVGGIRAGCIAPPHEDDVAFLGQAAEKQLLLGAESVGTDISVFDKVFVVGGACQPVVRQAGAELTHGCLVHDFHGGFRVQPSFA